MLLKISSTLAVIFLTVSCASLRRDSEVAPVVESDFIVDQTSEFHDPLQFNIERAHIVGEDLKVRARITAQTDVNVKNVSVVLSGLSEGETTVSKSASVAEVFPEDILPAGESAIVDLSIPATDIEDYQLQCNWDNSRPKIIAAKKISREEKMGVEEVQVVEPALITPEPRKMARVESVQTRLQDISVVEVSRDCSSSPCQKFMAIDGAVANNSSFPVSDVRLALGVEWVGHGQNMPEVSKRGSKLLPHERVINFGKAVVMPGDSKEFRINVDRALPELPGGAYLPFVRLLESN